MSLTSRDVADDAPHVERGVDREEVLLHHLFHVFIRQGMAHVLESLDRRAQLCVRLVAGDALLLLSKRWTREEGGKRRGGGSRKRIGGQAKAD